jgi:hypothetical protein
MRARRLPPSALSVPLLSLAVACADDGITRLQPKLAITPEAVDLGDTGFGQLRRHTITLTNAGSGALFISDLALVGTGTAAPSADLALAPPPGAAPWTLAPSAALEVGLDHLPRDRALDRGALRVRSDDPDRPEVLVPITQAPVGAPTIVAVPDVDAARVEARTPGGIAARVTAVRFGQVALGLSTRRTLFVVDGGRGNVALALASVRLRDAVPGLSVRVEPAAPALLAALGADGVRAGVDQSVRVDVDYAPPGPGPDVDTALELASNDPATPVLVVPITASTGGGGEPTSCTPATPDPTEPTNDACATAVARGPITLQLNGTETRTWTGSMEATTDEDWSLHTIEVAAGCDFVGYQLTARVAWPAGETGEVCLHVGDCANPDRGPRCASGGGTATYFTLSGGDLCNASNNAVPVAVRVRSTAPRVACQPYTLTFTAR